MQSAIRDSIPVTVNFSIQWLPSFWSYNAAVEAVRLVCDKRQMNTPSYMMQKSSACSTSTHRCYTSTSLRPAWQPSSVGWSASGKANTSKTRTALSTHRPTVGQGAYPSACSAAHDSILKSHADRIRSELDEVSGDIGATLWTAQRLLHNDRRVAYDDAECAKLVSTFSQFFVFKVKWSEETSRRHYRCQIVACLMCDRTPGQSCQHLSQ